MSFVIAKCKHNPKKYCKNWNGEGNGNQFQTLDGLFSGNCPTNIKECEFLVTAKPSPKF